MAEPTWKILRAGPNDLELARQAVTELHGRTIADESELRAFLSDRTCCLMLAVAAGRVLGSLVGYSLPWPLRPQPQFLLYEIDVRPDSRRLGIGTALVNAFTNEARAVHAHEVWVLTNESNAAAMKLYETCGYRRGNHDDVMFSLELHHGPNTQK